MNLILILLMFQTMLLGWWWLFGNRPTVLIQSSSTPVETKSVEPPASSSAPPPLQTAAVEEPMPPTRSFTEEPIRIQLLNGCGTRGLASRYTDCLRLKGFDVRETGNADRYTYSKTQVIGRVNNPALARMVSDSLGVSDYTVVVNSSLVDIEVTVILGKNYEKLHCR
jgi:hypothetical protein